MIITSLENEKIKKLIKLQQKKYRDETNTYIVEGPHLVEEAYKAGLIQEIFLLGEEAIPYDVAYTYITKDIMKKISTLETPSTIIALCRKRQFKDIENSNALLNKIVLLDEIQDPGNLGTIIRSSVAFGIDMILLSENTVDLYNPKVLRATQGMYTHIPIFSIKMENALDYFKKNGYQIYGTNVINGVDVHTLEEEERKKFCLIMGNEGRGLKKEIQDLCDKNLYIPMKNNVESLNVGVACSILLYELGR